jgi:ComF family protein
MPVDAKSLRRLWAALLDLVYPPRCVGCQQPGPWLCPGCLAAIEPVPEPICHLCGDPVLTGDLCPACRRCPLRIDGIRSVGLHQGPLREAVHGLKYQRQRHLAPVLAGLMAKRLQAESLPADVLVPVPLHRDRQRQRGYNQAVLLAEALAGPAMPVISGCLARTRPTRTQTDLGRDERMANVAGAFACRNGDLFGRRVLLIDDVCTTGATLEACALACRQAGAASVWALTLSRQA